MTIEINLLKELLIFTAPLNAFILSSSFIRLHIFLGKKITDSKEKKIHPIFNMGGFGIIVAFLTSIVYLYIITVFLDSSSIPATHLSMLLYKLTPPMLLMIIAGLIEHRYKVNKLLLLGIQILIAGMIWKAGISITFIFKIPLTPHTSLILTIIWFLFLFNLFKHTDGVGGIAPWQGMFILSFVTLSFIFEGKILEFILALSLFMACFGFFTLSIRHPELYIGPIGCRFIGFFIGILSILYLQKSVVIISTLALFIFLLSIHIISLLIIIWKRATRDSGSKETSLYENVLSDISNKVDPDKLVRKYRLNILGIPVDYIDMKTALALIEYRIENSNTCSYILSVNPLKVYSVRKQQFLKPFFSNAFLNISDGIGIIKALHLIFGINIKRVPGADLMQHICRLSEEKQYKLFFFGSKEIVNKQAVEKLKNLYPNINIVGRANGYMNENQIPKLLKKINDECKPDILFVSLGSPAQEEWIFKYYEKLTTVKICQGIGGTLDTIAGTVNRAPNKWQNSEMEWLYRIIKEPRKRLKHLCLLFIFVIEVFTIKLLKTKFRSFYMAIKDTDEINKT